jgi:hypothetical protein
VITTTLALLSVLARLSLCLTTPQADHRETIASIERNYFYDCEGRLVFDQYIFREQPPDEGPHIIAWRFSKGNAVEWDHARGLWSLTFDDEGTLRTVYARSYIETWTQHDRECDEREYWPQNQRRGLWRGK